MKELPHLRSMQEQRTVPNYGAAIAIHVVRQRTLAGALHDAAGAGIACRAAFFQCRAGVIRAALEPALLGARRRI